MRPVLAALALSLALLGCGPNAVGESCAYPGETRDCIDGAVCTPDVGAGMGDPGDPTWATYTCRVDCTVTGDCAEGFECRAITGRETLRSCQPVATAP